MCKVPGVSSSGFYDWFERPACQRERHNAKLLQAIKSSHERAVARMVRRVLFVTSSMLVSRAVRTA